MNILVIGTGGTIAERADRRDGWLSTENVLEAVGVKTHPEVSLRPVTVARVDSCDFSAAAVIRLAQYIRTVAAEDRVDGVLVLHGTDTLAELGFLLSIWHMLAIPVVATGARIPCTSSGSDAPKQVRDGLSVLWTLLKSGSKGEVCVVFDGQILDPLWVTKSGYSGNFRLSTPSRNPPIEIDGLSRHSLRSAAERLAFWGIHGQDSALVQLDLPFVPVLDSYGGSASAFAQELGSRSGTVVFRGTGAGHLAQEARCAIADWAAQGHLAIVVADETHGAGPAEKAEVAEISQGLIASPLNGRRSSLLAASLAACGWSRDEMIEAVEQMWLLAQSSSGSRA